MTGEAEKPTCDCGAPIVEVTNDVRQIPKYHNGEPVYMEAVIGDQWRRCAHGHVTHFERHPGTGELRRHLDSCEVDITTHVDAKLRILNPVTGAVREEDAPDVLEEYSANEYVLARLRAVPAHHDHCILKVDVFEAMLRGSSGSGVPPSSLESLATSLAPLAGWRFQFRDGDEFRFERARPAPL